MLWQVQNNWLEYPEQQTGYSYTLQDQQKANLTNAAIPNRRNLNGTITEKLQKYTDLKQELIRKWQLKTAYTIPPVLPTTVTVPDKLHESIKWINLRPGIYIPTQKAVILNTCRIVRKFLAEEWIRSAWCARTVLFWKSAKLLWSKVCGW